MRQENILLRAFATALGVGLGVINLGGTKTSSNGDAGVSTEPIDATKVAAAAASQHSNQNHLVEKASGSASSASVTGGGFFLEDYAGFNDCVLSASSACLAFDFNGDGIVSVLDYGTFQIGFLGRDCNGNHVPDRQDIADLTSRDVDEDGMPDECEAPTVRFSQSPVPDQESIASNLDWSDMDPNTAVGDDFSVGDSAVTSVRWWGSELSESGSPSPAPGINHQTASPAPGAARAQSSGQTPQASIVARSASDGSGGNSGSGHPASVQGLTGDTCDLPFVVTTIPFSTSGNTCGFADVYDEICDPNFSLPGSADVVYAAVPPSDITVDISLCGNSAYDTKLYVYENTCGPFQSGNFVACSEDVCTTPSFTTQPYVSAVVQVPMLAGNTYFIVVDGYNGDCGTYTLDITLSPAVCGPGNGDCAAANGTPGCQDAPCCQSVCAVDPICCGAAGGSWDSICANEAVALCQSDACGPGNGDCFSANGTPGCDDEACCQSICAADSFCCGLVSFCNIAGTSCSTDADCPQPGDFCEPGFWDAFCGDEAVLTCGNPPPLPQCPAGSLSSQAASSPLDLWAAGVSDAGWFQGPFRRFESFDLVTGPVCDIHWWGLNSFNDGSGFSQCLKNPDDYEIQFRTDDSGQPGTVVCSYSVTPSKVDTGLTYGGNPLYLYGADLDSCCALQSGWVSIQGLSSGDNCLFLSMSASDDGAGFHWLENQNLQAFVPDDYDLGLCLTGESRIDGWLVSFHQRLLPASPPAEALGVYFCDAQNVTISPTEITPCDGRVVSRHLVDLDDCCLIHVNPDSRSANVPARPGAFHAEAGLDYDIDIQAVTGHRFTEDPLTGDCVETATPGSAVGDFWAWHTTSNEAGIRSALTTPVTMGPGETWLYGPWDPVTPGCGDANMAFELLTLEPPPPP